MDAVINMIHEFQFRAKTITYSATQQKSRFFPKPVYTLFPPVLYKNSTFKHWITTVLEIQNNGQIVLYCVCKQ